MAPLPNANIRRGLRVNCSPGVIVVSDCGVAVVLTNSAAPLVSLGRNTAGGAVPVGVSVDIFVVGSSGVEVCLGVAVFFGVDVGFGVAAGGRDDVGLVVAVWACGAGLPGSSVGAAVCVGGTGVALLMRVAVFQMRIAVGRSVLVGAGVSVG
jgi:hypothetical protein